jgi:hypothetical protein
VEKETLYYKDVVRILEPNRSEEDIKRELALMGERKLVGTPPIVNLETLAGLAGLQEIGKEKPKDPSNLNQTPEGGNIKPSSGDPTNNRDASGSAD